MEEMLNELLAKDTMSGLGCDNMTSIIIRFKWPMISSPTHIAHTIILLNFLLGIVIRSGNSAIEES